jgi:hypothetical protein
MYHKANLNRIIAEYTGQPLKKVEEDTDRDRYMSPIEAREYGLIDHIVGGEQAVFNSRILVPAKVRSSVPVPPSGLQLPKPHTLESHAHLPSSPPCAVQKPDPPSESDNMER